MDKFEHEKHNRRERVYRYPRINLWVDSVEDSAKLRKQSERDALELRCLSLYRDFFRNPRNHEYVGEKFNSRKFLELSPDLVQDLKMGFKIFCSIEIRSIRYKEFMTPREFWFWDDSNRAMIEKYRADKEHLREMNEVQRNQDMLKALRRNRFEPDT